MKRRFACLMALLLVSVALAAPASAAQGSAVQIILMRDGTDLHEIGWSASGAINDSGDWTTDLDHFAGGPFHFVVAQVLTTHVGEAGSFGLRFEGLDRHDGSFAGDWEIIALSGTGAYSGLTGHGKWTWAADPVTGNGVFTLIGNVQR
jgi:hypothetical protein